MSILPNGTILVTNSHAQGTVEFRPRFEPRVEAGARMKEPAVLVPGKLPSWVRNARPGQRIAYHVGILANDREQYERVPPRPPAKPQRTADSQRIDDTARAAFDFFQEGLIVLCQIPQQREDGKRGEGYHYVAVRTDKPFKEKANG